MSDPRSVGPIPLTEQTWHRLYAIALYGAGASDLETVRVVVLGMLIDGVHKFFQHLEAGNLALGPQLLPDGTLVVRLGIFLPHGDPFTPIWWTMVGAEMLDFNEEETAWAYEMAERTGQVGDIEVPDPDDFEEGAPSLMFRASQQKPPYR
jgi:hypothetical protein